MSNSNNQTFKTSFLSKPNNEHLLEQQNNEISSTSNSTDFSNLTSAMSEILASSSAGSVPDLSQINASVNDLPAIVLQEFQKGLLFSWLSNAHLNNGLQLYNLAKALSNTSQQTTGKILEVPETQPNPKSLKTEAYLPKTEDKQHRQSFSEPEDYEDLGYSRSGEFSMGFAPAIPIPRKEPKLEPNLGCSPVVSSPLVATHTRGIAL